MGEDLRGRLEGYRYSDSKSHKQEMLDLERVVQAATLNEILALTREVAHDRTKLSRATKFAYRHTNGFRKITLFKSGDCCLRLHIWEPGEERAENVHSHRWSFASRVLLGAIEETRFKLDSSGTMNGEYSYAQKPGIKYGEFTPVKNVFLTKIDDYIHPESTVYSMNPAHIHRVNGGNSQNDLVTLVLTGKSLEPSSKVYSPSVFGPQGDRNQGHLTEEETHLALTQTISRLT